MLKPGKEGGDRGGQLHISAVVPLFIPPPWESNVAPTPANPSQLLESLSPSHTECICTGKTGRGAVPPPQSSKYEEQPSTTGGRGLHLGRATSVTTATLKLSFALQEQSQHISSIDMVSTPVQRYCRCGSWTDHVVALKTSFPPAAGVLPG